MGIGAGMGIWGGKGKESGKGKRGRRLTLSPMANIAMFRFAENSRDCENVIPACNGMGGLW